MSITFTNGANSITIPAPRYGYTARIAMSISWAGTNPPSAWDAGAAYDERNCSGFGTWLSRSDAAAFGAYLAANGSGRCEDQTMSLGVSSGFFPFGPDKGDSGDFTVRFVPASSIKGITDKPFLRFDTELAMIMVAAPAYTLPALRPQGHLQIGTVTGLRWPRFNPIVNRAISQVLAHGGNPFDLDYGTSSDSYTCEFNQQMNGPNAANLLAFLTSTSGRGHDITVTAPANHYLFGADNGGNGSYTALQTSTVLEITHDGYDQFSLPLEFYMKAAL